jgi:ATP synthase protein I
MKNHSGFKIGLDFFSGVLVGAFVGYGLDALLQTRPTMMCIFIVLGFAAGVNNVLKATRIKNKDD